MRSSVLVLLAVPLSAALSGCMGPAPELGTPEATKSPSATRSPVRPLAIERDGTDPAAWTRPEDQRAQARAAGLELRSGETLTVHYHAHLDVVVDGKPVPVPAGLGIVPAAGQDPAAVASLHTHETDGVLHVEAPAQAEFTLGQVFTEWGLAFGPGWLAGFDGTDGRQVRVLVDGTPVQGDPRKVALRDKQEIAVVVARAGEPLPPLPTTFAGL